MNSPSGPPPPPIPGVPGSPGGPREPGGPGGSGRGDGSLFGRFPPLGVALAVLLGLGAVVAVVLAFGAGGSGGEDPDTPPATIAGGTLRVAAVELASLDPLDARDPTAVMVADQLFDTLVAYDPETLEPVPALATSWEANPEQTVFTFRLAEGARFHDGSPVTSDDVKFTLERVARRESPSPLVAQLESVAGFTAYNVAGTADALTGVEAPDPATVVIRLDRAFAAFPAVLGHPGFGIVPRAAVEGAGEAFKEAPVGSGPFRLDAADVRHIRLVRFGGHLQPPGLERITLVRFGEARAAYDAFAAGALDVAPVPPGRVREAAERYGREGMEPFIGLVFYAMNLESPDLADPRLRQAISLAIDRDEIIRDVYGDTVELADGLVSDGIPGQVPDACGQRCAHDPERARALLREAFPDGNVPEVGIDHDDDPANPTQAAVAASIEADLDDVGIPAVVRPRPFADYGQFLVSGEQELFRLGWIADYPSPDGFLTPLFLSTSPENLTGLASPEVDQALNTARAEPDRRRRLELYRDVEQRVLDQFVVVPLAQLEIRLVVAERVVGFELTPLGTFDAAAVGLAAS